jgi:hypothetical protein
MKEIFMSKLLGFLLAAVCATGALAQPGNHDHDRFYANQDRDHQMFSDRDHDRDHRSVMRDRDDFRFTGRDREFRHAGWPGHDRGNHYGWYRHGRFMDRDRDDYRHHARFDRDRDEHARLHHVLRHETHHALHRALRRHEEHVASR